MALDMKNLISSTFLEMIQHKNLDKITIKDLVEACNISRQAFYYHFQDMIEVIEWTFENQMNVTLEKSLLTSTLEDALQIFISDAFKNQALMQRQLLSLKRGQLEKIIIKSFRMYLKALFEKKAASAVLCYEDLDVALDFYSCGITSFLIEKCTMKQIDEKKLASQLYRIISGDMMHGFRNI